MLVGASFLGLTVVIAAAIHRLRLARESVLCVRLMRDCVRKAWPLSSAEAGNTEASRWFSSQAPQATVAELYRRHFTRRASSVDGSSEVGGHKAPSGRVPREEDDAIDAFDCLSDMMLSTAKSRAVSQEHQQPVSRKS